MGLENVKDPDLKGANKNKWEGLSLGLPCGLSSALAPKGAETDLAWVTLHPFGSLALLRAGLPAPLAALPDSPTEYT